MREHHRSDRQVELFDGRFCEHWSDFERKVPFGADDIPAVRIADIMDHAILP